MTYEYSKLAEKILSTSYKAETNPKRDKVLNKEGRFVLPFSLRTFISFEQFLRANDCYTNPKEMIIPKTHNKDNFNHTESKFNFLC